MTAKATPAAKPAPKTPPKLTPQQQYDAAIASVTTSDSIKPHQALVELATELLAVFILVMLAGASPRGAKIATTTLASLWFVSLILHYNGSL